MSIWRKRASAQWLARHEESLLRCAGTQLAIIFTQQHKTARLEVIGGRRQLNVIRARFGGTVSRLPRQRFSDDRDAKPIRIGKRLSVVRTHTHVERELIIPAGAAFGTGEHVTTAMSLRLLDRISGKLPHDWSMLDLGTGSGILALAARKLGARKIVAIDHDPLAIKTARSNERLNEISGIDFRVADVRKFPSRDRFDVVTANLFSELLIEILFKLKRHRWLILSGVLREQERKLVAGLNRNEMGVAEIRRRGKWLAVACCSDADALERI